MKKRKVTIRRFRKSLLLGLALASFCVVNVAGKFGNTTTTVPSDFNKDKNHEVPLRLDYVFALQSAARNIGSIDVIKSEVTDALSDHYPVLLTYEWKR